MLSNLPTSSEESQAETWDLEAQLDKTRLPRHIAIIMDGNGRWARLRHLARIEGHRAAVAAVRDVVEACGELGISVLTLYVFSTENWQRPSREVIALMRFLQSQLEVQTEELARNNVCLRAMGELDRLPGPVRRVLQKAMACTQSNTGLILNLALSYGGRQEIVQGIRNIAAAVKEGILHVEAIDEACVSRYLYTNGLPEPDLLIRTSGETRISNFLLWQCAYTEFYFTPVLWPDFRRRDLLTALLTYQQRQRRFGGVSF